MCVNIIVPLIELNMLVEVNKFSRTGEGVSANICLYCYSFIAYGF